MYTNPSRATIPLIRPHQCDSEGGRIRGVLLYSHNVAGAPRAAVVIKGPKCDPPKVNIGVTLEEGNIFKCRWDVFVSGSGLDPDASSSQLFQCADDELGDSLLKTDTSIVSKPTSIVMGAMKSLAVIEVATGVMRAELVRMQQEREESLRTFAARVRGKAETYAYITKCTCLREVDFTDSIIRDVLIAGIADLDIGRVVLCTSAILERAVNDVISLVESKEMARNALPSSASGISSFKRGRPVSAAQPPPSDRSQTALCPDCKQTLCSTLLGGSSRLEHPTTPSMHQVLQRTPSQTKRRIASCRC